MRFPLAHAAHPQWRMAAALVLAQLRAQLAMPGAGACPSLALLYITDHYADEAEDILAHFSAELPEVSDWAGTVGIGLAVTGAEYFDEPALAVMLCDLPADQYRVYSGVSPLPLSFTVQTALIHADPRSPDLPELIVEMADRTHSGYLFGGLSASRGTNVQFALSGDGTIRGQGHTTGVFHGGLSGVAFGEEVAVVSRVTQGCYPVAGSHTVTECERNVVYELDGQPALQVLLGELGVDMDQPEEAIEAVRNTLAGLMNAEDLDHDREGVIHRTGDFGADVRVRHIIGLDPQRGGVALADTVDQGMQLAFCQRSAQAARADLIRICAEIREELEPAEAALPSTFGSLPAVDVDATPPQARHIAGAIYVSCSGRGGPHFGAPNAELQLVRHALGDVPLIGFFAGGEIARRHIYGYTGVLTVFLAE
jgi:small ligand-binding sensory domain FIST